MKVFSIWTLILFFSIAFPALAKRTTDTDCKDYSGVYGPSHYQITIIQTGCLKVSVTLTIDDKVAYTDLLILDGLPRLDEKSDSEQDISLDRNTLSAYPTASGYASVRTLITATKPISWTGFKRSYSFSDDWKKLSMTWGHYDMQGRSYGEITEILERQESFQGHKL